MSNKKASVPQIRFAGFTGDWEERKLGEVGSTYTGLSGKSKIDFGHGEGRYVTYMNVFTNAISSPVMVEPIEIDDKQNEVQAGDVFFTTSSETPEEVGLSSVLLENIPNTYLNSFCFGYRPIEEKFDNNYLAFMLRSVSVRENIVLLAQGISRYNISKNKVMEIEVPLPQMSEQRLLGGFFRNLDNLITLQQRQLDKLAIVKKTMLEKMFPKDGANVPEIRFAGFKGAWEERKVIEQVEKVLDYRGKSPTKFGMTWGTTGYLVLSALNVKKGYIDKTIEAKYGDQELFDKWMGNERLEKDDVIFTTEAPLGNVAQVPDNVGYILNQRAVAFKTSPDKLDNNFLATLLSSPLFQDILQANSSGGTAKGIGMKEFAKIATMLPIDIAEQKKIGFFFKSLDTLLSLHQRELNTLKTLKKSMLQQLFV